MEETKIKFVVKFVKTKEWDNIYSQNSSYTLIKKVKGGYRIGFCVIGKIPPDCLEATQEDLEAIRKDRLEKNILPIP